MPYFFYRIDPYYLYLVLPCILLSLLASIHVNNTFRKYSSQISSKGVTGEQAAAVVLKKYGISNVRIERISGNLNDHYDPRSNVIRLSDKVYSSASTAAIGVACHEAGHAVQYALGYAPIKIRTAIIPVTNFGSALALPLILLGFIISGLTTLSDVFIYAGIACFGLSLIFQLITLPVEFNASHRALQIIKNANILSQAEQIGAAKTLRAAAMTYLAATAISLTQFLRLILLFGNRRNRRN